MSPQPSKKKKKLGRRAQDGQQFRHREPVSVLESHAKERARAKLTGGYCKRNNVNDQIEGSYLLKWSFVEL